MVKNKQEEEEFEIAELFDDVEDYVNSPPHYGQGRIECIEYITQIKEITKEITRIARMVEAECHKMFQVNTQKLK